LVILSFLLNLETKVGKVSGIAPDRIEKGELRMNRRRSTSPSPSFVETRKMNGELIVENGEL
jgi:hypothetical protein